ncbi:MAG: hypothetical protein B7X31_01880 [Thiomonas sp. 13-66-29]|jgi:predicted HicB family RNase H-like nuclease|nr:MAG: hypothetical protein B7X46_13100 [Thiomonas sp. 15-66-11]OZB65569.1 MAG: hypothetical protein B7X31_01880 [Thiomonas sp. 13-66-29]
MKNFFEYKGYLGSAEVDAESMVMVGKLLFIKDTIAYSAESVPALETAFHEAVDEYLATCAELGDEPDTPCKGSFNVRVGPERHRDIAVEAHRRGMKLNELVCQALDAFLGKATMVEHHHQHDHRHTVEANVVVQNRTTPTELERIDGDAGISTAGATSNATRH